MSNAKRLKEKLIREEKERHSKKIKEFFKYVLLFFFLLFLGLFCLYQYLHLKEGFTLYFSPYNIQDEYAHFLVDVNDDFVKKMLMFEDIVRNKETYEDYDEDDIEYLSNVILAENNILSRLKNTPPDSKLNFDYQELYDNITYAYALYIQGQLMKMEYIMQTKDGLEFERYTIGESVTNLMGNFIIEYSALSNKVRGTSFASEYSVLDGLPFNLGTAEATDIIKDEDGNIILDADRTYLYLPDGLDYVEKEPEEGETSEESEDVGDLKEDITDYIDDYLEIQNGESKE